MTHGPASLRFRGPYRAPQLAFELLNDPEPSGLLMQFGARRPDRFSWRVIEAAPGAWRIRIAPPKADAAATTLAVGGG